MFPVVIGLNYRTAPVEIREKVSIHHSQTSTYLQKLKAMPGIEGVVLLSTCNRLEIYAVTTDVENGITSIESFLTKLMKVDHSTLKQHVYTHTLYSAVKHLFRVVSGLDSMVLGETQILGQVAKAYEMSCAVGVTNKIINVTFQKALSVGKKVRTETSIDQYPTSISYTAVELARQKVKSFKQKSIVVLGAGEMSALVMKHLAAQDASTVVVSNRSYERAQACAQEYSARAIELSEIHSFLEEADIVFTATSSQDFVITAEQMQKVMTVRDESPLLVLDIAVPRDFDPDVRNIPGIELYDIDDLRGVVVANQSAREAAAQEAEKIISKEMAFFKKWHNSLFVLPTITALQQRGEEIKQALLDQAMPKLGGISPKQEKVVRSLANSIINKFLHVPITTLKKVSSTPQGHLYTEIIQNTFALDIQHEFSMGEFREQADQAHQMEKAE